MELTPYLTFNGDCAAAFKLYEKVLGGKVIMSQTFGESPAKETVPPEWHNRVMHVHLEVGKSALMGSDAPPPHYSKPQGTSVSISLPSMTDAQRIFNALAEGGTVTMPFEKTFWSPGFGMLTDRYGTPWMVNVAQS